MIVAVHGDRVLTYQIMKRNERIDGPKFLDFLASVLAPAIERENIHRPLLLMDNAPIHFNTENTEYIIVNRTWDIIPHPTYSSNLNPLDFEANSQIKRSTHESLK